FALGESRAAADWLLTVAWHLATRLGGTLGALAGGIITRGKAELIVRLTQHLDGDEAAAVEAKILGRAGRLTPGGLRSAVARAVMEVAPDKARQQRETAGKFARVERWAEDSGNAALMGRELPPDEDSRPGAPGAADAAGRDGAPGAGPALGTGPAGGAAGGFAGRVTL